jgi:signal peptidase
MALAQVVSAGPADVAGFLRHAWAGARVRARAAAVDVVAVALEPPVTWARLAGRETEARLVGLAWPWAAWLTLLHPLRCWAWCLMVPPEVAARVTRGVARTAHGAARAWVAAVAVGEDRRARAADAWSRSRAGAAWSGWRADAARRAAAREASVVAGPRRHRNRPRLALQVGVWTVVVAGVGLFAASLTVPLWYQLHGQRLLIVTSGSMAPFVEAGDVAVLQQIDDPSQLRVGQVATFWPPGSKHLVTHRIVDLKMLPALIQAPSGKMVPQLDSTGEPIMRPYIYTKGDANETRDPNATPLVRVRGVVVASHPGWGVWLGRAQSPAGRFTLLAPPLVLLALLEVLDAADERRRRAARRRAPARVAAPAPSPAEVRDALGAS